MEYVPNEERGLDIMSEIFRKSYANVKNHLYELKKDKGNFQLRNSIFFSLFFSRILQEDIVYAALHRRNNQLSRTINV